MSVPDFNRIAPDVRLGHDVRLASFLNLYGCEIGDRTKVGTFVEVQRGVTIGRDCKVQSHSFICEGVSIGDGCFIGHGVVFVNDNHPRAVRPDGGMETDADWSDRMVTVTVHEQVTIGSNATILGGVTIGARAMIGAGSVVTRDVPPGEIWAGNPARKLRDRLPEE